MDITPEMLAEMHENAQRIQQEEEQRKAEARAQLAEQFAEVAEDQEIVAMAGRTILKLLEELEKLLREILKVDRDEDRKGYISLQILKWVGKQIKEEEKRISMLDRL